MGQNLHRRWRLRVHEHHIETKLQGLCLFHLHGGVDDRVDLRQNDHGMRAGFVCESEVSLQPCRTEVVIPGSHDEDGINIGGLRLARPPALGSPLQQGVSLQPPNQNLRRGIDQNPISDSKICSCDALGQADPLGSDPGFSGQPAAVNRRDTHLRKT
ncbi:hypothetical protein [Palleronia aestuarii]|uniref:hypothetical protein n=1 Tax=Palleronia aestuarii TaxID=568105 RepID=UPI004032F07D